MILRRFIIALTLILSLGILAQWGNRFYQKKSSLQTIPTTQSQTVLYYFLVGNHCHMCKKIQDLCELTLAQSFPNELKNHSLSFVTVDTSLPENQHFLKEFQLTEKSLVLIQLNNQKESSRTFITDFWDWLDDPKLFHSKLTETIRSTLVPPRNI